MTLSKTPPFTVRLGDDGIARMTWASQTRISLDLARACHAHLLTLRGDRPGPLLVDLDHINSVTREARVYFASASGVTAVAMVGHTPLANLLGDFFIRLAQPTNPTRLFTAEAEAVDWLKGFIE